MLVVRGTKKLRDRITGPTASPEESSTTVLGDWFATALFWRPQVALLVNGRTLLPVFLPLAPTASLVAAELTAMDEVRSAPTNNRSVVRVMTEFAYHGKLHWQEGLTDLAALSYRMSSLILGPLHTRGGSPDRALAGVIHPGGSEVVDLARRAAPPPVRLGRDELASFQLKVTLLGLKPPVWRRLIVHASTSLDQLHEYIQAAFGWWNYHLYEFEVGRTRYAIPDPEWDFGPPTRDARRTHLNNVAAVGDTFRYNYDFGDGWEHKVVVEKAIPRTAGVTVPACTDGRRACPPEDCGGPWGYQELLAILADPSHPEPEERVIWAGEWAGGTLDPEAFDPAEFADNLDTLRLAALD